MSNYRMGQLTINEFFSNLITFNLTVILTCCAAQGTLTVALPKIFLAFATILLAISFAVAKEKSL
jgi:hypothetical protein